MELNIKFVPAIAAVATHWAPTGSCANKPMFMAVLLMPHSVSSQCARKQGKTTQIG